MGSNCDFRVSFEPAMTEAQESVVLERLYSISDYRATRWQSEGMGAHDLDDARWSRVNEDLQRLSSEFPNLRITCWQRYHDDDTQFMIYVHRTQIEVVEGEITFRGRTLW